jgi:hypothetical protein
VTCKEFRIEIHDDLPILRHSFERLARVGGRRKMITGHRSVEDGKTNSVMLRSNSSVSSNHSCSSAADSILCQIVIGVIWVGNVSVGA